MHQALICVFRSIPAFNNDLREVQNRMEDVAFKLRIPQRKPWDAMSKNVARSQALVAQKDKVSVLQGPATGCDECWVPAMLHGIPTHALERQSKSAACSRSRFPKGTRCLSERQCRACP